VPRFLAIAALAALSVACHSGPPAAIDPKVSAYIPSSATILAGVNLRQLRTSPFYGQLPPAVSIFLEPLKDADSLLIASDGKDYLVLSRGAFRQTPAGTTLMAPGVAATGTPGWLEAAVSHSSGSAGSALLERAQTVAAGNEIWMVAAGGANLPVSGNAGNLNRLLHDTQYTTLTVRFAERLQLDATGVCASADAARQLQGTVQAFVTLGAAATKRQPQVVGLLKRIQVLLDANSVHVKLSADTADLGTILGMF
jgi:hypothetical protein